MLDDKLYDKSTTDPQQVACNNQQVIQRVAQLVVRQIHPQLIEAMESDTYGVKGF